jgi:uncharacterized membrane protein
MKHTMASNAELFTSRQVTRHSIHRPANIPEGERWVSLVIGGLLSFSGLRRRSLPGGLVALLGGVLIYRGATGHSWLYDAVGLRVTDDEHGRLLPGPGRGVRVEHTVTIRRPGADVYRNWRDLEKLPRWLTHLDSVHVTGDRTSHWVAKAPVGRRVEWDAEIVEEQPNERIGWRAVENAEIRHAGLVTFRPAPGDRGTEMRVVLEYEPLGGPLTAAVARLFGEEEPAHQIREDLRRFKQMMEAREIPTTAGQPTGRGR